jgi:hypothetical protein
MKKISLVLLLFLSVAACNPSHKKQLNFSLKGLYPEKVEIKSYGNALFSLDTNNFKTALESIKDDYIYFLDGDLNDSSNLNQIYNFVTDTLLISMYNRSQQVYPDLKTIENELTSGLRRFHYYFPEINLPEFYTYISGVDFEAPVLTDGNAMVIALDCYLGADETIYRKMGIPNYISNRMTSSHLVNDVFKTFYSTYFETDKQSKTILDEMIKAGKQYYFLEAMQPDLPDHLLIGYSKEQLDWLKAHEADVWAFLVGEQMLYANDFQKFRKLFGDGPFTQDFSTEAPARIGEWVGWQIIRHYVKSNPEICIKKLIGIQDSQDILTDSRYRPKK